MNFHQYHRSKQYILLNIVQKLGKSMKQVHFAHASYCVYDEALSHIQCTIEYRTDLYFIEKKIIILKLFTKI